MLERRSPSTPPTSSAPISGVFQPSPLKDDTEGHTIIGNTPSPGEISDLGSGGNFLSNEIFYRIALVRKTFREKLATGHFHLPSTNYNPNDSNVGGKLINGMKTALERLFAHGFRLSAGNPSIDFPQTDTNTTAEQTLTVTNKSTETLKIASIGTAAPFSVDLSSTSPLPITINPGASLTLTVRFSPTVTGPQTGKLTFRESSGEVLLIVNLSGTGKQNQPPPAITSFFPNRGPEGTTISIFGDNFTDATDVRIGGTSIGFYVISPTQISADIDANVYSGFVQVDTLSGTAGSSTMFFKTTEGGPRDPNDPIDPEIPPQH